MPRRLVQILIAAAGLAACAHPQPEPPAAPAGMSWSLSAVEGEGEKLAFGRPASDHVLMMLTCAPGDGAVRVSMTAADSDRKPRLQLASGRSVLRLTGETGPSGLGDGEIVEAVLPAAAPVLGAFADTGRLTVTVSARRTELPAAPTELAGRFVARCRG